ncbi:tripartite tricarboxylate transporter TctB family protein [Devosia rhodophyticola]|uniref:Tripartite tricarboxylate transporter TctB family protein n=1 Tax=Devosia rhodophyticola TaxID=3026423 RepID=A0ABY7YZ39_9HYPH|nr:tripartite tricarboxylate transporter TctB family protein [Devosia rhodophyticola]
MGPDFLPTVVAYVVGTLTLIQLIKQVAQAWRGESTLAAPIDPKSALAAIGFGTVTICYFALLAYAILPFYISTTAFVIGATLIMARSIAWREVAVSAVTGIVLGVALQFVFTKVMIIDLPT